MVLGLGSLFVIAGLILNALGLAQFPSQGFQWALPLGAFSFLFMLASVVFAARTLRRLSAPLDEMLSASRRVAEGEYATRVEEKGPPEIRSLARGFNSMAERLQSADRQRRNLFADVSHELRTPLTVIQGNVEGMLDGLYPADEKRLNSILEETQLLSRLVDDLRTLSLAESGALELRPENLDPILPLQRAKEEFQKRYINEVLERNNGNRTKTAKDLGVDPRTIFRHLEKLEAEKQGRKLPPDDSDTDYEEAG